MFSFRSHLRPGEAIERYRQFPCERFSREPPERGGVGDGPLAGNYRRPEFMEPLANRIHIPWRNESVQHTALPQHRRHVSSRLRQGQALQISGLEEGVVAVLGEGGELIGLGRSQDGVLRALRLTQAADIPG